MFLSDRDIKNALREGSITIEDFDESRLQPSSYDILLGNEFLYFDAEKLEILDPKKSVSEYMKRVEISEGEAIILQPNEFMLAVTKDFIGVNNEYNYQLMGKSSLARLGLIIHTTAGFIDPGNRISPTLELFNANSIPIKLYAGMKIGQVAFCKLFSPAERSYGDPSLGSKYFGSRNAEPSQMWKNFRSQ